MDQPNLNMRHKRWLAVVKDYDCKILYHPVKANVLVDALIRKTTCTMIQDICLRMMVTSPLMDMIK